jgi:putative transposase
VFADGRRRYRRPVNALMLHFFVFTVAGWISSGQQDLIDYLREENRVLREQLRGRRLQLTDDQRRRLAIRAKVLGRAALQGLTSIVTPDTLLAWYRKVVAAKYNGAPYRGPGRPRTASTIAELAVRMAMENPTWGYTRIRGALANLGHEVGRNTIKRILKNAGMEPAPERGKRTQWKTFIREHLGAICATDFFTVEVLTMTGIVRYFVLFVIDLKTRRVHVAGIAHQVYGKWVEQVARNLTDPVDGFLKDMRYLIHDRDPVFTKRFADVLASTGVKTLKLPSRSPNLNAFAERFVRSIRDECLRRIVPLGERHLRRIITEYMDHYHRERNHQSLDNQLVVPRAANENAVGPVQCRERLGGMLRFYYRNAA